MECKKTVLYENHLALGGSGHLAEFAGYLMPLWYTSISSEHEAVRKTAGMFDCTHMGILEICGGDAEGFLNLISTNNVSLLKTGQAQYSYILDTNGKVLDDIIIYKLEADRFMVVVNAANEPKVKAWVNSVVNDKSLTELKPEITDVRSRSAGQNQRVDIALQGPVSTECLSNLSDGDILSIKPFRFINTEVAGTDVILSRTGYTGSKAAYELYVHPDKAADLWRKILDKGGALGVMPCGLGARDSLRIEAGLPLHGHELAGGFNISPFEAGYGWAVKLDKDFFIGQAAMEQHSRTYNKEVIRIKLSGRKGVRPVREGDGIVDGSGICQGWVTSCAKVNDEQVALAYVERGTLKQGETMGLYYLARSQSQITKGKKESVNIGVKLEVDIEGEIVSRFEKF